MKICKNDFRHISSIFDWKNFSQKSGSVTFWILPFCIIVPTIMKKLMSRSREKLVTNERTNGRTDARTNKQRTYRFLRKLENEQLTPSRSFDADEGAAAWLSDPNDSKLAKSVPVLLCG